MTTLKLLRSVEPDISMPWARGMRRVSSLALVLTCLLPGRPSAAETPAKATASPATTGSSETANDAGAVDLMREIESRFRATRRAVRMDIKTVRDPDQKNVGRPDQIEIWGVLNGDPEHTDMLFVFTKPRLLRGTGLMISDPWDPSAEDELWYHMRSFNRFQRLPQRSLKVLVSGTCVTYEDAHGFLSTDKYNFTWSGPEKGASAAEEAVVIARPKTSSLSENLGYQALKLHVDRAQKLVRRIEYTGLNDQLIKTYEARRPVAVGDAWLAGAARVEDLRSSVVSEITFTYQLLADVTPNELYDRLVFSRPLIGRLFDHLASQGIQTEAGDYVP